MFFWFFVVFVSIVVNVIMCYCLLCVCAIGLVILCGCMSDCVRGVWVL